VEDLRCVLARRGEGRRGEERRGERRRRRRRRGRNKMEWSPGFPVPFREGGDRYIGTVCFRTDGMEGWLLDTYGILQ
jgi:hypothetical protein